MYRKKPLYGLLDVGDYWYGTFRRHLINELNMETAIIYPALFYSFDDQNFKAQTEQKLMIPSESDQFLNQINISLQHFKSKERTFEDKSFAGLEIHKRTDHVALH